MMHAPLKSRNLNILKCWLQKNARACFIASVVGVVSVIFDLMTPLGVAAGVIYVVFVLTAFGFEERYTAFVFAAAASIFTLKGYFLIPDIEVASMWIVQLNRALSVLALWVVAIVVYRQKTTEQQIADESLKRKKVTDTVLDGLITIDAVGIILSFNPAAVRIFGYVPEEVIGNNIKMLMPEPYHSEHDYYIKNYHKTGDKKVIGIGREVSAQRKNGSVFPMELGINEMKVDGKRMYVGTIRDISERREAEAEILRSNQELERFAYVASHDLQEPLRMVINFTQLLKKRYEDELDDRALEYIQIACNGASRMQQLVKDLLEYARINNEAVTHESVNLELIKPSVEESLYESIKLTGAQIHWPSLPSVLVDPVRIRSVFQNVIGNAIKYRKINVVPKIVVDVTSSDEIWLFSITDNGIGMKQEYCEKIFEPFKRLHLKEEYSGTGMGLSICRKSLEVFGGKIWAESQLGVGSTFYFSLPKSNINNVEGVNYG